MNKKSKLLVNLVDKNILIKNGKKLYLKAGSFKLFEINKTFLEKRDWDEILIIGNDDIVFEYWIKQDLFIPPWETHWFQLKDSFLLKLKGNLLNKLLCRGVKKAGNLYKLCKFLDMTEPSFYNMLKNKVIMISVKKLKRLSNYLDVNYILINNKIEYTKKGSKVSIMNPKFPINLNSKYGALLLGCIVSDGCIYIDKKARDVIRTKYSTSEKESIKSFIDSINKIYGKVHIQKEDIRNCEIIRIGSSIIGNTLFKVGAILGHKAKVDGCVPWLIRYGPETLKVHYLKSVFSDEASIYIGKKPSSSFLVLSRYKHLNDLTKKQKKELTKLEKQMSVREFPTGHTTRSLTIKKTLGFIKEDKDLLNHLNSVPKLLLGESNLLNGFNIKHRIWNRSLNITPSGNYSVCCDLYINRKKSLLEFYEKIGFSLSCKQKKFIKLINKLNI